ncbi:DUF2513 domain-containing protein [Methylobacterium phyllostachyos]|nr:DUF2513 domain-containing protein [Methylobacterium phyllostachyos]
MARDMDFIRELLLKVDRGERTFETASDDVASALGISSEGLPSHEEAEKLQQHIHLLERAGFLEVEFRSAGGYVQIRDLTYEGYDLLDSIRDPDVWKETKSRASQIGGWTVDIIKELAKSYLKQKAQQLGFG